MKLIKLVPLLAIAFINLNIRAQPYSQLLEVISSGGGESSGGNYSHFGVIGETFVNYASGRDFSTNIGFLQTVVDSVVPGIENFYLTSITVYPNPFCDQLKITVDEQIPLKRLRMFDLLGRVRFERELGNAYETVLQTSAISNGMYLLVVESRTGRLFRRWVIKH